MKSNSRLALLAALAGNPLLALEAGLAGVFDRPQMIKQPWVSELDAKVRRGPTSPSVPSRQRTRAEDREGNWSNFRMKRSKKGTLWNDAHVKAPRFERRNFAFGRI